jgi:hypothetical protein
VRRSRQDQGNRLARVTNPLTGEQRHVDPDELRAVQLRTQPGDAL